MRMLMPLFLLLLASACREESQPSLLEEAGYAYFPLEVGRSWTYQVDSLVFYNQGARVDSSSIFMQDRITGVSEDAYVIDRAFRQKETEPWETRSTYILERDSARAFRVEDNLRLIPLVFPVREQKHWDPTVFFDKNRTFTVGADPVRIYKGWTASIASDGEPYMLHGRSYEHTLEVHLADMLNAIELRYARERYAREVGLIEREWVILDSQCLCCPVDNLDLDCWVMNGERGFVLRQQLIDYW